MRSSNRDTLFTFLLSYVLCGVYAGHLYFLDGLGPTLVSGVVWKLLIPILGVWALLGFKRKELRPQISEEALPLGLLLLVLGDFLLRRWTYFGHLEFRQTVILGGLLCAALFIASRKIISVERLLHPVLLLASQLFLLWSFLRFADGRMIFSDDHPSFLYRLSCLVDMFPRIPFYNPDWNAGWSAREFFATGAIPFFLLVAPIAYFIDFARPENLWWYTAFVGFTGIVFVPWCVYASARLFRLNASVATISGIIALAPALALCEWLLHYGTLGFVISVALSLPLVALASIVLVELGNPSIRRLLLLALLCTLCFLWPLAVVIVVPVGVAIVSSGVDRERSKRLSLLILLYGVLNCWWIPVFLREARVLDFLTSSKLPAAHVQSIAPPKHEMNPVKTSSKIVDKLREQLCKLNPALFFVGLPLLWIRRRTAQEKLLFTTVCWLIFLTTFGDLFKPQLELRRMILPIALFLCLPTASYIVDSAKRIQTSTSLRSSIASALLSAACFGFVVVAPFNARSYYLNRSDMRFVFAPPELPELASSLRTLGGEGRVFVLGFVLHELGASNSRSQDGGHIALLPLLSRRSMYASHFYHARWSAIDPIPSSVRARGPAAIEKFLDTLQVSGVVALTPDWQQYVRSQSNYTEVSSFGKFTLFARRLSGRTDWIESGEGEVLSIAHDRIKVTPKSQKLVLRFRHDALLRVFPDDAAKLSGEFFFDEEIGSGNTAPFNLIRLDVGQEALEQGLSISIGYNEQE